MEGKEGIGKDYDGLCEMNVEGGLLHIKYIIRRELGLGTREIKNHIGH